MPEKDGRLMNVLVADDDPTTRALLKRILIRDFDCTVTEVENGLEALTRLDEQRYSILLLDVHMPVMSGLEALKAIRGSAHSSLPVVMLTAERGAATVKRAVAFGIADYLVKPLRPKQIAARLEYVLHSLEPDARRQAGADPGHLTLDEHLTVLVAEGDPDYRQFLMDFFRPRCTALEASSGSDALTLCLKATPRLVFVGGELGIIDADTLVRRIRVTNALTDTRVIATVPRSRMAETQARGAYDGVIACSFVPEVFLEQFERLTVLAGTPAQALERVYPRFRMGLITATEQVFGMALSAQVELVAEPVNTTNETLATTLLLTAPAQRMTVVVTLQLPIDTADALTRRMRGCEESETLTDEDRAMTLAELLNMIVGRVQNSLAERGVPTEMGLPETGQRQAPVATDATGAALTFETDDGLRFDLIVVARRPMSTDASRHPSDWADTIYDAADPERPWGRARRWPWGLGWLLDRFWGPAHPKGHRTEPGSDTRRARERIILSASDEQRVEGPPSLRTDVHHFGDAPVGWPDAELDQGQARRPTTPGSI